MLIQTLSTFPHMYDSVMGESMMKRAQEAGIVRFEAFDLRDWTHDRHRTTDDYPYGGGHGLVMKCEPVFDAVEDILGGHSGGGARGGAQSLGQSSLRCGTRLVSAPPSTSGEALTGEGEGSVGAADARVVFLSPVGRAFDDAYACELAESSRILFVCGHYEGMDERVYSLATDVVSLGDYVLTSGELASMVIIDAVARKLPGVLGAEGGADDESFAHGLLEYPQYTRPAEFRGMAVPEVLLSGHHANIEAWRREQSLARTAALRPDLIEAACSRGELSPQDEIYLRSSQSAQ